jgi:hypothetical protein
MKQFIFLVTVLATSIIAKAQEQQPLSINAGDIQQLTVVDNMDILLLQGSESTQGIFIDKDAAESIDVRVNNNHMEISMRHNYFKKERRTVCVYVNDLKKLTVLGDAVVKTKGVLNSSKLDLFVQGNPYVYLLTNGKINAFAVGDSEINVQKFKTTSVSKGF